MNFLKQHKTSIVVVLIVILAFTLYAVFFVGDGEDETLLVVREGQPETSAVGAEVLRILNRLEGLDLDASVFDDPTFNELRDFSRPVQQQPIGRDNPFAPL